MTNILIDEIPDRLPLRSQQDAFDRGRYSDDGTDQEYTPDEHLLFVIGRIKRAKGKPNDR